MSQNDPLCEKDLTDARIRRVLELPAGREYSSPGMAWEGVLNAVRPEELEPEGEPEPEEVPQKRARLAGTGVAPSARPREKLENIPAYARSTRHECPICAV